MIEDSHETTNALASIYHRNVHESMYATLAAIIAYIATNGHAIPIERNKISCPPMDVTETGPELPEPALNIIDISLKFLHTSTWNPPIAVLYNMLFFESVLDLGKRLAAESPPMSEKNSQTQSYSCNSIAVTLHLRVILPKMIVWG